MSASYLAAGAPGDTIERLRAWAAAGDGRTFIIDDSIAPVPRTATVDYEIDADSAPEAERLAVERYASEAEQAGIPRAETVIAATGRRCADVPAWPDRARGARRRSMTGDELLVEPERSRAAASRLSRHAMIAHIGASVSRPVEN